MRASNKIAVICACPPGTNPGMSSVDLAFWYLADKYDFLSRAKFYQLYPSPGLRIKSREEKSKIQYSIIPDDVDFFKNQDLIFYWGDFFHMYQYHKAIANVLVRNCVKGNLTNSIERVQENTEFALESIVNYEIVITDAYHVCANAWNFGVPAICFFGEEGNKIRDVNSGHLLAKKDKRQVFMSMYDGLDFLISYAELYDINIRQKRLALIVERLASQVEIIAITNRIRQHAISSEQIIMNSIYSKYNI